MPVFLRMSTALPLLSYISCWTTRSTAQALGAAFAFLTRRSMVPSPLLNGSYWPTPGTLKPGKQRRRICSCTSTSRLARRAMRSAGEMVTDLIELEQLAMLWRDDAADTERTSAEEKLGLLPWEFKRGRLVLRGGWWERCDAGLLFADDGLLINGSWRLLGGRVVSGDPAGEAAGEFGSDLEMRLERRLGAGVSSTSSTVSKAPSSLSGTGMCFRARARSSNAMLPVPSRSISS
eukprot:CAMPEP_0115835984 /NCGR_PEP_ID=MMETSP0287-20121206/4476_1 /TAXON_ID=412157 /ORGANISM="Chrysochromulina rotalis, Strain UIO044" /LENGTH=233 /DNA_ID=CAMNT_0003289459 /DNA_START=362 /DNA_END=1063 /DNA_ORIENTATION=-